MKLIIDITEGMYNKLKDIQFGSIYSKVLFNKVKEGIPYEERPTGHWFLLDECSNEGVYCSNCHKKVYRVEYANQKVKSNYCPNCGAYMMKEANNDRS